MEPAFYTVIIRSVYVDGAGKPCVRLQRCPIEDVMRLVDLIIGKHPDYMMEVYSYDDDEE